MFQGGLRKQLLAVTGIGILVVAVLALVAMRTFVVEAFTRQMRDGLTSKPFLQARQTRYQSLAHVLRVMTVDNELNTALKHVDFLAKYGEAVLETPADKLKDEPTREKLRTLQQSLLEIGTLENSDRLFLNMDPQSQEEEAKNVGSLADLLLVCNNDGVVILERRTNDDKSLAKERGKVTVHFPLTSPKNFQLPRQLSVDKNSLFQAALKQQSKTQQPVPQRAFFQYGDGWIYDGVALPLLLEKGVVILADRVDQRMAAEASRLVGDCDVVALSGSVPQAAVLPGKANSEEPASVLHDKQVEQISNTWLSQPSSGNGDKAAQQLVQLNGHEYLARVCSLSSAPHPVFLESVSDSILHESEAGTSSDSVGSIVFLKTTAQLEALVTKQYLATLVAVLLAVGISFVIVGQLVGRLAKPLLDLASSMSKVGKGDLEVTAPIAGPTEIQDAAKAFNQMIDSLRQKDTLQALVNRLEEIRKSADVTDPLVRDQAQFGKYVVARRLGGGGMATVYVGLPIETLKEDHKVALKVIHREFAGNEEYQSRFKREYEVMLSLQHPGLIRVIDAGSLNGLLYIVMEYVEGKTLADHLEGKPGMPVRDFLGLVMPLLEAMHHSHEKGIVHRDLKPENLMLTPVGIKVMDFGLAMSGDMSRITQSGSAIGTPRYMSPEQINGQVCDGRCDQYALGIMFYEMLAGRCPFDGNDVLAIVFQHLSQTPQSLSVHRTDLPAPIVDAVAKMLSKDPHLRFNSLLEIRDIFSKLIT